MMNPLNKIYQLSCLLLIALVVGVSACKTEDDPEPVGEPPVADAGSDLDAAVSSSVTLDGTGSSDPESQPLTYAWALTTRPDGSSASVTSATQATTTFIPDVEGTYVATLTVTDPDGNTDTDDATITATEALGEPPVVFVVDEDGRPISEDAENNTVTVGTPFFLDGSNTIDPDTDSDDLTFTWEITEEPSGSSAAVVNSTEDDPDEANFIPDIIGEYTIRLTVTDPEGNSTSVEVEIVADANPVTVDQSITVATTWPNVFDNPDLPDYKVVADISVQEELIIAPGVKVIFEPNRGLTITGNSGALSAIGKADSLIVFTAEDSTNGWDGIVFFNDNSQNEFNYADISYGGNTNFGSGVLPANIGVEAGDGVTITNSTISNSFNYGVYIESGGKLRAFTNNTVSDNNNNPVALPINQVGNLDNNSTYSGNTDNTVEILTTVLNEDEEVLVPALSNNTSYFVSGRLDVDSGLKIEAGASLEFDTDAFIEVSDGDGYLNAIGTEIDSIVFTAREQADGWGGIVFFTANSRNSLAYTRVSYGGNRNFGSGVSSANIGVEAGDDVRITNSTIANSVGDYGIYIESGGTIEEFGQNTFTNNDGFPIGIPIATAGVLDAASSFSANGDNSVEIFASTLGSNNDPQTLPAFADGTPYYISGRLDIDNDLTIKPGANFEFNRDVRVEVSGSDGSLSAVGTMDSVITMTARDQGDGWLGIVFFTNTVNNKLNYVNMSYGGQDGFGSGVEAAMVGVEAGDKVAVSNSTFTNSFGYGIFVESGAELTDSDGNDLTTTAEVEAAGNTFSDNAVGATNLP
ncbi:MAG: PKD domain-containing protein [Bacteroidota bacterium]